MVHFRPPPKLLSIDYSKLRMTQQSSYLCLTAHHAPQVLAFLKRELPSIKSLVDGTAHIGCDTLNFAIAYPKASITAIDIDAVAISHLDYNLRIFFKYPYQLSRFTLIRDDFLKIIRTTSTPSSIFPVDLIYLDCPWGGPDYYKKQRLLLYLSETPLHVIVNEIFTRKLCTYVLLKVPKNFDVIEFTSHLLPCNSSMNERGRCIKFFSVFKMNNRIAFTLILISRDGVYHE